MRPARGIERHRRRVQDPRAKLLPPASEPEKHLIGRRPEQASMLAHIELGADEAEGPNLAAQPQQIPVRDCVSLVRTQALIDQVKVGLQRLRRPVSFGFALQGGPEPPPDEGKLPPVGLVPCYRSKRFLV